MLLRILLFLLLATPCFAQEAGTYNIILDTDGSVVAIKNTKLGDLNETEKARFKIIQVDVANEDEFYNLINPVMESDDSGLKIKKVDDSAMAKDTKVDINVFESKISAVSVAVEP